MYDGQYDVDGQMLRWSVWMYGYMGLPDSDGAGVARGYDTGCSEGVESMGWVGGASGRDQGAWLEGGDFSSVFTSTLISAGGGGREV